MFWKKACGEALSRWRSWMSATNSRSQGSIDAECEQRQRKQSAFVGKVEDWNAVRGLKIMDSKNLHDLF